MEIGLEDSGKKASVVIAQEILPSESDMFQIQFGNKLPLGKSLIELELKLIYDITNKILDLPKIIICVDNKPDYYSTFYEVDSYSIGGYSGAY